MPVYNLANVLGMGTDQINSMFSNPQFQQQFGAMFANNPNMYSGIGNLYTNNPTFKAAFGQLANQNWGPGANSGGGSPYAGGGGGASGAPIYSGPGASSYQLQGGNPVNYASMFQPPNLYDLQMNPSTGMFGMSLNPPRALVAATSPYDPTSQAQMNTPQQTMAGLQAAAQAAIPKTKSPTFWEQAAPYITTAATVAAHFL